MRWFYDSSLTKSLGTLNNLVHQVLLAPDFNTKDLAGFDAAKEAKRLDNFQPSAPAEGTSTGSTDTSYGPKPLNDGWTEVSVPISLPCDKVSHPSDASAPVFNVKGLLYRKPLEVIKAAFQEPSAMQFHLSPFEEYWKPSPESPPERIYSELYNSNAYIQEQEQIRSQPRPECGLETVIAPIMLWSDSTHLTSFGNASLWPIYLYLGSLSKYTRAKPTSFAAHHLAYIPKLSDSIQDFYKSTFGKPATADILTHLRRELMHAVWRILLDDEFTDAYANGIVIIFPDGIQRRLFPRFFTYSADYPEKVLLCCIKYLGNLPCPRCLVHKSEIQDLGTKRDLARRETKKRVDDGRRRMLVETARDMVYMDGVRPGAKAVSDLLASRALTPTHNAFSECLSQYGFDFHSMFVVDLMHEFELGVWKAVFTHLLRILYAQGGDGIQKLNERYFILTFLLL
ncbi:hypothetical protein BYT27DRAFT_7117677 [Phlegmacium glaucopus]|nr:hypothetical protein BYT27DRAFT_7117677 [Phlegmacium glaucopus]